MMWNFDEFSTNTALIGDDGNELTYAQLLRETEELNDVVGGRFLAFCLCTNTVGSVLGYVSFIQNRTVPMLFNAHMERDLLGHLLAVYAPEVIWAPESMADGFSGYQNMYRAYGYCLLKNSKAEAYPMHGDLGLLLSTSGSTGSRKFVRQSYQNIETNALQIVDYLQLDSLERPVTTLPMNYTYGLSVINSHLFAGGTILLTDCAMTTRKFWTFMREKKATSIAGVPYTYEMLDRMRFCRMDLPDLSTLTQAGGKLSPSLHKKFAEYAKENGKRFIVMYGACEATARMGYLPAEYCAEKCGSMGIAVPGGKFRLTDDEGKTIEESDVVGELVYEGKNVTMGYAECREDLARGDERGGVLATGDMAKRDKDGFYTVVGRKKRFLKIYGNRVNLDEIDRLIKEEFDFTDCASGGKDDHMVIFVTEKNLEEKVRMFIAQKTGLNAQAFRVVVLDEIPKNDAGKVRYAELEKYCDVV